MSKWMNGWKEKWRKKGPSMQAMWTFNSNGGRSKRREEGDKLAKFGAKHRQTLKRWAAKEERKSHFKVKNKMAQLWMQQQQQCTSGGWQPRVNMCDSKTKQKGHSVTCRLVAGFEHFWLQLCFEAVTLLCNAFPSLKSVCKSVHRCVRIEKEERRPTQHNRTDTPLHAAKEKKVTDCVLFMMQLIKVVLIQLGWSQPDSQPVN